MVSKLWFKVMHTRQATKPVRFTRQEKELIKARQAAILAYLNSPT